MAPRQSGCPDTVTRVQAQPEKTGDNTAVLRIIAFYQRWISPLLPPRCRFVPSCSVYASEAIRTHGTARGALMSVKRVCRCHPFHPGGYDPVPLAEQTNELSTVHEVCEHDEQPSTNRH